MNFTKLIIFLIILIFSFKAEISAQDYFIDQKFEISIGRGSSLYNDIKSDQLILFIKIPPFSVRSSLLSFESDINIEYISKSEENIYVLGLLPFLKYNFSFKNINLFLKGGIGLNYLNHTEIGNRSLGGHFIFSDMIGIGSNILEFNKVKIEFTYLFRHISNAGLYKNNEGYNSQYFVISLII